MQGNHAEREENYRSPAPENLTLRTRLQVKNKSSRNCGIKQFRKCVCHLKCMAIILRSKSKTNQKLETDTLWDSTQCAKMPVPESIITTPDQYSISNLRRAANTKFTYIQDGRKSSRRASGRKLENHGVWDCKYITYTNACGSQGITAPQQVTSKMRN